MHKNSSSNIEVVYQIADVQLIKLSRRFYTTVAGAVSFYYSNRFWIEQNGSIRYYTELKPAGLSLFNRYGVFIMTASEPLLLHHMQGLVERIPRLDAAGIREYGRGRCGMCAVPLEVCNCREALHGSRSH